MGRPTNPNSELPLLDDLLSKLPVLPTVVSRMLSLDKESDDYYEDVLSLASEDPIIAAKVIQLASSAAHAGRAEIETLPQAVARVGINQVSSLITSITLTQSFSPTSQLHRNLWVHALQVAVTARKIAQLNRLNAEQAYLAGLLHEIGRFILLMADMDKFNSLEESHLTSNPELLAEESQAFGYTSADVAIAVLSKWCMPEPITVAITHHLKPTVTPLNTLNFSTQQAAPATLADVLSVSDSLSLLALQNPAVADQDESEIEPQVVEVLASVESHGLFAAPTFLAKALPGIIEEVRELASSLGVA
jgi:HD-like signal output (HDOD) protein